ncbi:MAG: glycogen synthase GlgA [Burkholderiales bacterium]
MSAPPVRILQVGAEIYPLVKTGGLGDVLGALPGALARLGMAVRLLLPGYPALRKPLKNVRLVCRLGPVFGAASVQVLLGRLPDIDVPVYLIDAPSLYDRPGNPYLDNTGQAWADNPQRFGLLGWVAAYLALGDIDPGWRPQLVHGHDWHAGLASAYLALHPHTDCRTVFTVHNLAFHGLFPQTLLPVLQLPESSFSSDGLEFHGEGSMIKAGLHYADAITTVSPSYAREIQTTAFGCGLEGVITQRRAQLHGILNGVDYAVWNSSTDPRLEAHFDTAHPELKAAAKAALQRQLGLRVDPGAMLIGVVSRLTAQKGIDLLLEVLPNLLAENVQLALLGSGDAELEAACRALAAAAPGQVQVSFAYDETLAHRIIAGVDVIAVPSRFEPCGLTQLYGLRYGSLPLVHRVGGLADTVVDADDKALAADTATGFVFNAPTTQSLEQAVRRALTLYRQADRWKQMVRRAMVQDFSWDGAAAAYADLYRRLLEARPVRLTNRP